MHRQESARTTPGCCRAACYGRARFEVTPFLRVVTLNTEVVKWYILSLGPNSPLRLSRCIVPGEKPLSLKFRNNFAKHHTSLWQFMAEVQAFSRPGLKSWGSLKIWGSWLAPLLNSIANSPACQHIVTVSQAYQSIFHMPSPSVDPGLLGPSMFC